MRNRKMLGWALMLLLCATLVPATAFAEEAKGGDEPREESLDTLVIEVGAAINSKYVWRGQRVTDDPVLQAEANLSLFGFTAGVWGNMDIGNANDMSFELNEINLTLSYGLELGPIHLEGGIIAYYFPDWPGDTAELYLSGGIDVLLNPTLTIYHDVDEVDGTYVNASVSYVFGGLFNLTKKVGLSPELRASVGWADDKYSGWYYALPESGLADLQFDFIVPWRVADMVEIYASASYTILMREKARDRARFPDTFWIGVGASLTF